MYSSFELSESSFLFFPENSSAPARANPEPMAVPQHRYKKKNENAFFKPFTRDPIISAEGLWLDQVEPVWCNAAAEMRDYFNLFLERNGLRVFAKITVAQWKLYNSGWLPRLVLSDDLF